MAGFGDTFGPGSTAYQMFVWQIVAQVIGALAAPGITELTTEVNSKAPVQPLSAADAATAANRSFLSIPAATAEAARQGVNADRFATLRHLAGNAPAPEELATALRRGIIDAAGTGPDAISFEQGIAEGNLLNKWGPTIQALAKAIPSPADIVDAMVKSQVTETEARALYETVGGDLTYFQLLVDTNGNPPSPTELLELAQRGVIPWNGTGPGATTFQQGFYEGRSKDKWEPVYQHLAEYFATASEVIELYRWGQFTVAEATQRLAQRGVAADDAARWIAYGDANAIDDYRGLTEQAILAMLSISYITDKQARTMLAAIHRGPAAIDELIAYGHIQRAIQSVNQSVSRVGALYQARKIVKSTAAEALTRLGVSAVAIPDIIADWDAVAAINVKTLTEAQVADAFAYNIMDEGEAVQELINIGYTPYDAWVILSVKLKTALPGKPAQGPGAALGAVTPGTT